MDKQRIFWCVFENGNPIPGTLKYTRKQSIDSACYSNYNWKQLKRRGCTCEKVEINIVDNGK